MEAQPANPGISQLSSMNAFYGSPITSPETTVAIEHGAQAPEVYKLGSQEPIVPEQTEEPNPETAQASPLETYFNQATEQLNLSEEAVAMQQQTNTDQGAQQATDTVSQAATAPETETSQQVQAPEPQNIRQAENYGNITASQLQPSATSERTTAATPLNTETMPEQPTSGTENNQSGANSPPLATYGSGPAASNASQAGNLFSARG